MIKFKKIDFEDGKMLADYYEEAPYESCEYSAGIKLFWNKFYPYEYAVSAGGSLILKYTYGTDTVFEVPAPFSIEALDEIDSWCMENEIIPMFSDIPRELAPEFALRYHYLKLENPRYAWDYVYAADDLKSFKGRHYAGQRNHINKFKALYPNWSFRALAPGEELSEFWEEYYALSAKDSKSALQEKEVAIDMVKNFDKCPNMFAGCIEIDGKVCALSVAEKRRDTLIIHIEKALTSFEGIYPLLVSEFLKAFAGPDVLWVNREEDESDRGLRISKTQYRPCRMVEKLIALPQSELLYLEKIPEIKTQRLVLSEIAEKDAESYQKLCLDEGRNKYWGYDYRKDLPAEYAEKIPAGYFAKVAKGDFENRMCINFAIHLGERFIGEAIVYHFDLKGSAEIGCRILPEYAGSGYGTEAFAAAANWAIYELGLCSVNAKCYKENAASIRMLQSCMQKAGEDDTFCYFIKMT